MNYELFDSMTSEEAQDHLLGFLDTEKGAIEKLIPLAKQDGLEMDFSMESLPTVLKWILKYVQIIRVPVPDTEPDWIKQAHKAGFTDFPEESKYMILRAAYYLGECFVREYRSIKWAIGNPEFMQKNMPVITGFKFNKEMPVMTVCENSFCRILADGAPESRINDMIQTWINNIP